MKQLFAVLVVAGVALALGADDKKDDAKAELKKFQGTWQVVSAERDGEKVSADDAKKMKAVVKDDTVTVYNGDKMVAEMTFTVDPTRKPRTMDLEVTRGDDKGKKSLAIYEMDGDTLKVCVCDGKERPRDFSTKKGSDCHLYTYQHEKK